VDLFEEIQNIISTNLNVQAASIHCDSRALDFFAWDSVNHLILVTDIERKFDIKFSLAEIAELDSVEKIIQEVQKRVKKNRPSTIDDGVRRKITMECVFRILRGIRPESEFYGVDDFFSRGMLDSFDLTTLVFALEERFGISIDGTDIVPENFRSAEAIVSLLTKYGAATVFGSDILL
jgi:acyl carrier protein